MTAVARKRAEPAAVRAAAIKPQDRLAWHKQLALDHGLPHVALRVGICISTHFNNGTAECFPALPTIAREIGVSRSTAIRAIKKLAKQGHLRVRKGGGRGLSNVYVMNVSQPYQPTKNSVTRDTLSSPKQCQTEQINSVTGDTPTLKENSKKESASFSIKEEGQQAHPENPPTTPNQDCRIGANGRAVLKVGSPQWQAWLRYYQASGDKGRASLMQYMADSSRWAEWEEPAEWPADEAGQGRKVARQ